MTLIQHRVAGEGSPAVVFVHGFACGGSDWDAQSKHLSRRYRTVSVDLRGHGASTGTPAECSIERYGADIAEVMHALDLPSAVLVGHSMGCRVAIEAALQAPSRTVGVVLVDGSQFAPAMDAVLKGVFATPDGYPTLVETWFRDMFTPRSDAAKVAAVIDRARRFPQAIGEKMLLDLLRYDVVRLPTTLGDLTVPVMAIQSTYSNERRERQSMRAGQTTPYLDMLRARLPSARIEIVEAIGHFPQIDAAAQTNALLESFLESLAAN